MKTAQIRSAFLKYFQQQDHLLMPGSALVPENDTTLLFTNAGMNQFKNVLLGLETPAYPRVTSNQGCIRAGGKHNDLDQVGMTARHHTFFEMLGNFSFGDYFKEKAIQHAWIFLTDTLSLPKDRLWVTVYHEDQEAIDIWSQKIGVPKERLVRMSETTNFWQMADTGPCGPCTEIFYDHGDQVPGSPPGAENDHLDRYVEIWNIVFVQYDRQQDGELVPLAMRSVDTGMGIERIAAVLQGVSNNYDTDIFQSLIQHAAQLLHVDIENHMTALRIIADHIRSSAFLIAEGVLPSNTGRGYVLRRILRRAIRQGYELNERAPFLYRLHDCLKCNMGEAFPILVQQAQQVISVIQQEEILFAKTLHTGMTLLEKSIDDRTQVLSGELLFRLYDTHGFPIDLVEHIARDKSLTLDQTGFQRCLEEQRERSRQSHRFADKHSSVQLQHYPVTEHTIEHNQFNASATIIAIFESDSLDSSVSDLHSGEATILLSQSIFYAEAGGQIGDTGKIYTADAEFEVMNCTTIAGRWLHYGQLLKGCLSVNDQVDMAVDSVFRYQVSLHHSATHLLQAALKKHLGQSVQQKGSLVTQDRLRFDFSWSKPLTSADIDQVEQLVNQDIQQTYKTNIDCMSQLEAQQLGALSLPGQTYGKEVRVVTMGGSKELCGGTHAACTGDLILFSIVSESSIAAGIRRIEACVGQAACAHVRQQQQYLLHMARVLRVKAPDQVPEAAERVLKMNKELHQRVSQLEQCTATYIVQELKLQAKQFAEINTICAIVNQSDRSILKVVFDQLKEAYSQSVIVLASSDEKTAFVLAAVSPKSLAKRLSAAALIDLVIPKIQGRGGGRQHAAQAVGTDISGLPAALSAVQAWVQAQLTEH